ncbi:MAG: nitrile hydratase subunit beta [Rubrivivax sp.]
MKYHSHADLGGEEGHGPVVPEPEAQLFHAAWEARALAITLAAGGMGAWNIDMSRAARETLPRYRQSSYYRIWLDALEKLLAERGFVSADELGAGHSLHTGPPPPRVLQAAAVGTALARGSPTQRVAAQPQRFQLGDRVRACSGPFAHHTRLPAYARQHNGVIARVHGCHVFADAHAQGQGEQPQWLYSVAFHAAELWGAQGDAGQTVSIDAWESYLEPA